MIGMWCLAAAICVQNSPDEMADALALLDRLDSTIVSVDYRNEKLQVVLDDLTTRLPAPFRADWPSLERLGIDPDDRVTFAAPHASAAATLAGLMLTMGDEFDRPVMEAHAGQYVLTTQAGTAAMKLTGVYDVRDLLADTALMEQLHDQLPPSDPVPNPSPDNDKEDADDGREDPASPATSAPAPPPLPPPTPRTPGEKLLLLITDHVDPDAWLNFGGNRALVSDLNGVLMVTATPSTHRRFHNALRRLRNASPSMVMITATLLDLPRTKLDSLARLHASNPGACAVAASNDADAKFLWRSAEPVTMGGTLEIDSAAAETKFHIALSPTLDRQSGIVRIAVQAATEHGPDRRSVKTLASLPSDQSAVLIELPPAQPGDSVRLLVVSVQRR